MVLYQKMPYIFQLSLNGSDDGVEHSGFLGFLSSSIETMEKIHKSSDSGILKFISTISLYVLI